jgi:hypothetical protein
MADHEIGMLWPKQRTSRIEGGPKQYDRRVASTEPRQDPRQIML